MLRRRIIGIGIGVIVVIVLLILMSIWAQYVLEHMWDNHDADDCLMGDYTVVTTSKEDNLDGEE